MPNTKLVTQFPSPDNLGSAATLQEAFHCMIYDASSSPELRERLSQNPVKAMLEFGISPQLLHDVMVPVPVLAMVLQAHPSGLSANIKWFGFQLILNQRFTAWITSGEAEATTIAEIICTVMPSLRPIAPMISTGILAQTGAIAAVNQGQGVHFNLNWLQIANPSLIPIALIPYPAYVTLCDGKLVTLA